MFDQMMLNKLNERGEKYGMAIQRDYGKWYVERIIMGGHRKGFQFDDFESAFNYFMDTYIEFEVSKSRRG